MVFGVLTITIGLLLTGCLAAVAHHLYRSLQNKQTTCDDLAAKVAELESERSLFLAEIDRTSAQADMAIFSLHETRQELAAVKSKLSELENGDNDGVFSLFTADVRRLSEADDRHS